jgi:hypothetical protein
MSECGVSSVAVVDDGGGGYGGGYGSWGGLNGAVSVTDIGKVHFFPAVTELEIDWCLPSAVNVLL